MERSFSQGRILLSHVCNRLSVQLTCTLLCIGVWSVLGYVKNDDVKAATALPDEVEDCNPWYGNKTVGLIKPTTCTHKKPHPWLRVQFLAGMGAGYPGKPQGSP